MVMPGEFPRGKGSNAPGTVRQKAKVPSELKGSKVGGSSPKGGGNSGGTQRLSNGTKTGIMRNPR